MLCGDRLPAVQSFYLLEVQYYYYAWYCFKSTGNILLRKFCGDSIFSQYNTSGSQSAHGIRLLEVNLHRQSTSSPSTHTTAGSQSTVITIYIIHYSTVLSQSTVIRIYIIHYLTILSQSTVLRIYIIHYSTILSQSTTKDIHYTSFNCIESDYSTMDIHYTLFNCIE